MELNYIQAADYFCQTNLGKFTIQKNWADAAVEAGGTITGVSGLVQRSSAQNWFAAH
jgi:hypothetical protein